MINWNTRHEKKDVRLQQGLDLKQWGCYYRPYNLKASVEERVIMGKVCACACLKLHLVSIVRKLQELKMKGCFIFKFCLTAK